MTNKKAGMLVGIAFVAAIALTTPGRAEPPSSIDAAVQALVDNPKVKAALDLIKADDAATFVEQKRITEIASPSEARAATGTRSMNGKGRSTAI